MCVPVGESLVDRKSRRIMTMSRVCRYVYVYVCIHTDVERENFERRRRSCSRGSSIIITSLRIFFVSLYRRCAARRETITYRPLAHILWESQIQYEIIAEYERSREIFTVMRIFSLARARG